MQGRSHLARGRVPRPARGSPRQDELEDRRRLALLAGTRRVHPGAQRDLHTLRARDRRRMQSPAAREVHADGHRTLRRSLQLAERRHAGVRDLHDRQRDGVRDPGPGSPRQLRIGGDAAHEQVHQPRGAHGEALHGRTLRERLRARPGHAARVGSSRLPGRRRAAGAALPPRPSAPDQARRQRALALPAPLLRRGARRHQQAHLVASAGQGEAARARWRGGRKPHRGTAARDGFTIAGSADRFASG